MSKVGLYIHIPFCTKKCNYCNFYSISGTKDLYHKYIQQVLNELKQWQTRKLSKQIIDTVYIGGGTPSVLGTELLHNLLSGITSITNISSDAEITVEVNPNSVHNFDLHLLKSIGLNRISMGLQSINDDELKLLGRQHNSQDAINAIEYIRKSGIDNYSLDVMLGIPLQTEQTLYNTIKFCTDSEAEHISTYILKIEEGTPFHKNAGKLIFANEDMQADFYEQTCAYLKGNGYRHYEISNFCKNNRISKHNMKYWKLDDYVGIGPSAHSLIGSKRYYYPSDINKFNINNIMYESEGKTPDEYIMLSLRTDGGFEFKKYKELFNLNASTKFMENAKKFEKLGLMNITDSTITLTEKGYLVSNPLIAEMLNTEI